MDKNISLEIVKNTIKMKIINEKTVQSYVDGIKRDRGQTIKEIVWDMILNDNQNSFDSVICALEQIDYYKPEDKLAIIFAKEVISQLLKYQD